MPKRKCANCKQRFEVTNESIIVGIQFFHSEECRINYGIGNANRLAEKAKSTREREQKKKDRAKKKELMSRGEWLSKLQAVFNQWVREVKEKGKPCRTCGNTTAKMNAGHYKAVGRGGADRRRFEPFNVHRQCEYCNTHRSGAPVEYREFLINEYGLDKVEWLENESNFPSLKEQFPHWTDIENEISRYRKILRSEGLKPCV